MPCCTPPAPHPYRERETRYSHSHKRNVNHEHSEHLEPPSSLPDTNNITLVARKTQGVFSNFFSRAKKKFLSRTYTKSSYFLGRTTLSRNALRLSTIPVCMFFNLPSSYLLLTPIYYHKTGLCAGEFFSPQFPHN